MSWSPNMIKLSSTFSFSWSKIKNVYIFRHLIHRMGAKYLQQTLNEQLGKHIKEKLPGIRTRIQQKIHDLKATLQDLGPDHLVFFQRTIVHAYVYN